MAKRGDDDPRTPSMGLGAAPAGQVDLFRAQAARHLAALGATPPGPEVYATLGAAVWPYLPELVAAFARGDRSEARDRSRPRLLGELAQEWLEQVRGGGFEGRRVMAASRRSDRVDRLFPSRGLAVAALLRLGNLSQERIESWDRVPPERRLEWARAWRLSLQFEVSLLADADSGAGRRSMVPAAVAARELPRAGSFEASRILSQLLHAEERLGALGELLDYPLVVFDEGRVVGWMNSAAERFFEGQRDEVLGSSIYEMLVDGDLPEDAYVRARGLLEGREQGLPSSAAVRLRRPDGALALVEATLSAWRPVGVPDGDIRYSLVLRDLSEPGRVEEALRRSETGYRALIEHSPDGVLVVRDGRILYANPAFLSMVERTREEVLAVGAFSDLVHPDERESARRAYERARTERRAPRGRPLRVLRPDGSVRQAEVVALPLPYGGGQGVLVVVRDLTERLLLQARVMRNDRLLTVGTLARGITHEINNPLTCVISNVDFALRELAHGPVSEVARASLVEALGEGLAGADRVRSIVAELRAFTGEEDGVSRAIDLSRLVRAAVGAVSGAARQRAVIEIVDEGVPPVLGNEARLGQVFLALLMNAIQAIPETSRGGRIEVHLCCVGRDKVEVGVRDSGVGIPPEHLARVFDPFFTTRPLSEGTGLGLSLALGVIQGMGGTIEVSSTVGEGSRFVVLLPAAPQGAARSPGASRPTDRTYSS